MDFEVFWNAVCADVRKDFDTASTYFCAEDIWVCEPLVLHVMVQDSPVGLRLSITLSHEVEARLDGATRSAAARLNASGVGVRADVSDGGIVELCHGSMLSAYTPGALRSIVEMLANALLYLMNPQEARADLEVESARAASAGATPEVHLYLVREVEMHGGTVEEQRDSVLLYGSGRDVIPHPRAVPNINSVTTECPDAEACVDGGGIARGPIA